MSQPSLEQRIREAAERERTPRPAPAPRPPGMGETLSEEIKRRLPVEDYLGVPAGRKILCPLPDHDDGNPSCHIYGGNEGWYCHGCQRGGSVIDLVMHRDGIDERESIHKLADELGIERIPPVTALPSVPRPNEAPPPDEPPYDGDGGDVPRMGGLPKGQSLAPALEFVSFRDLAARVDAAGPRKWLLRGLWPSGDYGIHAAEMKAQKTWNTCDLAVSVASGTPWLGAVPVDQPGPVLMFAGEGGEANLVRRIRACAEASGVNAEDLPIVVCARAPHLSSGEHLAAMRDQLEAVAPVLVTLDPLYLAARGANLRDLYEMGALLEAPQHLCQQAGASLFVVTHFNRKQGTGSMRITGAGPAEWGRVLVSATVLSRHTDPATKATTVLTELDVIGGEVADQTLRLRRRIWSDDPDDLDAALHLEVAVEDSESGAAAGREQDLTPAAVKLLEALEAAGGEPRTGPQLVDWIAEEHGHGLKRETVSRTLNELERRALVDSIEQAAFQPKLWIRRLPEPPEGVPL